MINDVAITQHLQKLFKPKVFKKIIARAKKQCGKSLHRTLVPNIFNWAPSF